MNYDEKLLSDADAHESASDDSGSYVSDGVEDMRRRFLGDLPKFRAFLACDPLALDGPPARELLGWAMSEVGDDAQSLLPNGHAHVLAAIKDYKWRGWASVEEKLTDEWQNDACDPYDGGE